MKSGDQNTWTIPFGTLDQYIGEDGASGDKSDWLITTKSSAIGEYYADEARDILRSSTSNTAYTAKWYNRNTNPEANKNSGATNPPRPSHQLFYPLDPATNFRKRVG